MSQPHEIPDIAAEAAQSGVATIVREPTERGLPKINPEAIAALLDELEACYLVLVAAKG